MVYIFNTSDGTCLERCLTDPTPPLKDFQANHGEEIVLKQFDIDPHQGVPLDRLSLVSDEIQVEPEPIIYCHIETTGGDGEAPPGVLNDGGATSEGQLAVTVSLRDGPDPGSNLITHADAQGPWRIVVRDQATGAVYRLYQITLSGGQQAFTFTTDQPNGGEYRLDQKDFNPVTVAGVTYKVQLAGPVEFLVVEPAPA